MHRHWTEDFIINCVDCKERLDTAIVDASNGMARRCPPCQAKFCEKLCQEELDKH